MPASDYVYTYLHLWCGLKDGVGTFAVRNYLQARHKDQATRAQQAKGQLIAKIKRLPEYTAEKGHPELFMVGDETYLWSSISRVFDGKGAPNELQDVVWLASLAGMVNLGTLPAWADANLGVDCGGFVANYWGMGRPSETQPKPPYASGFTPREIWHAYAPLRRKAASQIQIDDAAIFFQDVKNDNPDIMAKHAADGKSWDRSSGSQAHHIAVVNAIVPAGGSKYFVQIAESSEGEATSGGNGVNVRYLASEQQSDDVIGPPPPPTAVELKVANNLVFYQSGNERVYFVGRPNGEPPYPQENQSL